MKRRTTRALQLFLACLCGAGAAQAGDEANGGTFGFVFENDVFYRLDRHYTNGLRLTWVPGADKSPPAWAVRAARWLPWFPDDRGIRHGYAFGQSMFTPSDITLASPPLTDRPYAGWLYGAIGLGVVTSRQFDLFSITVGMVGPLSFAEQTQKFLHDVFDSDEPMGWDTQIRNEPGIVLTYHRSWRGSTAATLLGMQLDLTPHLGVALGNVFTYAGGGATLRYGPRLPDDYGPPHIQPGLPGSSDFSPADGFGWYLFAGVEGRAVARNLFLDGNTFRDSRSVDREVWVGDLQLGIVVDWRTIRLSYTHVIRSREFRGGDTWDDFGSLGMLVKL